MTETGNTHAVKIALIISVIAAVIVFELGMNLLKYAHTENSEYAKWQMLPDKAKNLKTLEGQPVHPMPARQRQLTKKETMELSAGLAVFSPLSVFPICFIILRRRKKIQFT
jgi:hypothetical protein